MVEVFVLLKRLDCQGAIGFVEESVPVVRANISSFFQDNILYM